MSPPLNLSAPRHEPPHGLVTLDSYTSNKLDLTQQYHIVYATYY